MKKNLIIILSIALTLLAVSCKKVTTDGVTRVTYYPTLTLLGPAYVTMDLGSTFSDPGFTAIMNEEDISDQVEITDNIDSSKPGLYTVNYSFVNPDGITASAQRYVIVAPAGDKVTGHYVVQPGTQRVDAAANYSGYDVLILPYEENRTIVPGVYNVSDLLGGWYDKRAGYGVDYRAVGIIQVGGSAVSMLYAQIAGWPSYPLSMTGGKWDEADGVITYTLGFAGMPFYVILKKD